MASHSLFWEFPYVFTLDAIKQNNFTDGFFSFFQLKNVIHNLVYHRVYKTLLLIEITRLTMFNSFLSIILIDRSRQYFMR